MLTIIWTESDLPITFKKRYSFWCKESQDQLAVRHVDKRLSGVVGKL